MARAVVPDSFSLAQKILPVDVGYSNFASWVAVLMLDHDELIAQPRSLPPQR
jgi:hypothetical protein